MSNYIPIPVLAAKSLADCYKKAAVVILALDAEHGVTHTTTYGTTAFDKENAAAVGELCTKAIGGDLSKKQEFEHFHSNYDAANYKAAIELLEKLADGTRHSKLGDEQMIRAFLKTIKK